MSTKTYYGRLSINEDMLHLVKCHKAEFILDTYSISITLWKSFLEEGDYGNAICSINHTKNSYYYRNDLSEEITEEEFYRHYNEAMKVFNIPKF